MIYIKVILTSPHFLDTCRYLPATVREIKDQLIPDFGALFVERMTNTIRDVLASGGAPSAIGNSTAGAGAGAASAASAGRDESSGSSNGKRQSDGGTAATVTVAAAATSPPPVHSHASVSSGGTPPMRVLVASMNVGNAALKADQLHHWLKWGRDAEVVAVGLQESVSYHGYVAFFS